MRGARLSPRDLANNFWNDVDAIPAVEHCTEYPLSQWAVESGNGQLPGHLQIPSPPLDQAEEPNDIGTAQPTPIV